MQEVLNRNKKVFNSISSNKLDIYYWVSIRHEMPRQLPQSDFCQRAAVTLRLE